MPTNHSIPTITPIPLVHADTSTVSNQNPEMDWTDLGDWLDKPALKGGNENEREVELEVAVSSAEISPISELDVVEEGEGGDGSDEESHESEANKNEVMEGYESEETVVDEEGTPSPLLASMFVAMNDAEDEDEDDDDDDESDHTPSMLLSSVFVSMADVEGGEGEDEGDLDTTVVESNPINTSAVATDSTQPNTPSQPSPPTSVLQSELETFLSSLSHLQTPLFTTDILRSRYTTIPGRQRSRGLLILPYFGREFGMPGRGTHMWRWKAGRYDVSQRFDIPETIYESVAFE